MFSNGKIAIERMLVRAREFDRQARNPIYAADAKTTMARAAVANRIQCGFAFSSPRK
jgi:hypothetical protein